MIDHFKKITSKITDHKEQLEKELAFWRFRNQKIVFTNGCFDILHRGHVEYLAQAASLGNLLILGLNTDRSVKQLKGEGRPVNDQYARALVLAGLGFISKVVYFDEETPYELIKYIQPDVLVKGSDYLPENIVGYDIVKAKGGEVATISFVEGFSTTSTIHKLNHQ